MSDEKRVRKTGVNASALGAGSAATTLLTVTTGRTFVMTDLVASVVGLKTGAEAASMCIKLFDAASSATAAPTASGQKFQANIPSVLNATGSAMPQPLVITGLQNGPEFKTAILGEAETATIATYGAFIGGYEY